MTIRLLDYAHKETFVDVGNIEDIAVMHIDVLTGDEVLVVTYKDYTTKTFDSSDSRYMDFHDWSYDIYSVNSNKNLLGDERFVKRTKSYWYEYEDEAP